MGLPHFTLDLRAAFAEGVVAPFVADHAAGLTPNPCVRCNGDVRLDAMLAFADRLGAADLATGHYARVSDDGLLRAAADPAKDQSYMLAGLAPASVARMRFPLGGLRKPEVRELAARGGLPVADKRESQDLCFLAGTGQARVPRAPRRRARRGAARSVDRAAARSGEHDGQHLFTVGQRKGLGVAAEEPVFVLRKDAATNTVVVGPREALATRAVAVRDAVLHRAARAGRPRSSSATAPPRSRCRAEAGATARCGSRSTSPSTAPRPARSPACCAATSSSGTASSPDGVRVRPGGRSRLAAR